MSYETITYHVRGISPLLMHNGRLANPLDPFAKKMKALTGLRKKTDETHVELSKLEFLAGLYLDSEERVIIPSGNIEGAIAAGARLSRQGKEFKSGVMVADDAVLDYGKPLTPEELWADYDNHVSVMAVKVQKARIMRTRPIFHEWAISFAVQFNSDVVDGSHVTMAVEKAGSLVGLCDFRPKYGRFEIEKQT